MTETVFGGLWPEVGFSGVEDQGLIGSLSVLMKLGLFEMKSGAEQKPVLEIGSPIFDEVNIKLNPGYYSGKEIKIITKKNDNSRPYLQSIKWNGKAQKNIWLDFASITKGGELKLKMCSKPNMGIK